MRKPCVALCVAAPSSHARTLSNVDRTLNIRMNVDTGDEEVDKHILDIATEQAHKFAAARSDRLDAEGVKGIKVRLDNSR